jgi:UPF0716 protein FxsA
VTFRSRLLLFGYPLLEVVTAYAVGLWLGWGWMLLLLLVGIPIGFAIMRNAGDAAMVDLQRAAQSGQEPDAGRHGLAFLGGLLIMIPGFWTDLAGLLLVLPPTQRLLRARSRAWLSSRVMTVRMPGVHNPGGDVIQGTVIRDDSAPNDQPPRSQSPSSPPELT